MSIGGYRIERKHLPAANSLNNKLLLADAGFTSAASTLLMTKAKGSYLVRGSQNLNPKVQGSLPTGRQGNAQVTGKSSRDIDRRSCRAEVLI